MTKKMYITDVQTPYSEYDNKSLLELLVYDVNHQTKELCNIW